MPKSSKVNGSAASLAAPAKASNALSRNSSSPSPSREELKVPTDAAALLDGPAYVRAVASQVDLVGASAKLIVSSDEKIAKAELDRLRELIFGKGGPPPADDAVQIDWTGIPRPAREFMRIGEDSQGDERDH